MKKTILFCFLFSFVVCCQNSFKPPPYAFENWTRDKTTVEDTKKIMKICRYPNIAGEGFKTPQNEIALMHLCMEDHGFKYTGRFGTYCHQYPNLPACVEAREEAAKKSNKGN
ncbi:MAG: hypothetical protein U1E78_03015 [Gammaproteobacteria bacterium]